MITCTIDGRTAYPRTDREIKIIRQNPLLKETEQYTLDIAFPLTIPENLAVFGHVGRLDVGRTVQKLPACRLLADNQLVIEGTGTVTQVSPDEVRLQIASSQTDPIYGGNALLYIDEQLSLGGLQACFPQAGGILSADDGVVLTGFPDTLRVFGREGHCLFVPAYDNEGQQVVNDIWREIDASVSPQKTVYHLRRLAPQPHLLSVVERAWQLLGYSVKVNDYWREPWNRLYIANVSVPADPYADVARCLPHWTVRTLLEQFRLLFGAIYRFDGGTVYIVDPTLPSSSRGVVPPSSPLGFYFDNNVPDTEPYTFEPADDFRTDYDDDGSANADASNLAYQLSDEHSEVLDGGDIANFPNAILSDEARKAFTHLQADSFEQARTKHTGLNVRQQNTTIIDTPQGSCTYHPDRSLSVNIGGGLVEVDIFQPLIRDAKSDDSIELRMVPVAMRFHSFDFKFDYRYEYNAGGKSMQGVSVSEIEASALMPVMQPYTSFEDDSVASGGRPSYPTVVSVITGEDEPPATSREETDTLQLFFFSGTYRQDIITGKNNTPGATDPIWWPQATNDPAVLKTVLLRCWADGNDTPQPPTDPASLRLSRAYGTAAVAAFHPATRTVENRLQTVIDFMAPGQLPDPTRIFIFKGKRYQCEKLEIRFIDGQRDPLVTGYFYQEA